MGGDWSWRDGGGETVPTIPMPEIETACGGGGNGWKGGGEGRSRDGRRERREKLRREREERDKNLTFFKLPFYPSRYFDCIFFVTTPIRVHSVSTDSFRRALRNGISEIAKFILCQKVNFFPIK